jgi:hypothetical protein
MTTSPDNSASAPQPPDSGPTEGGSPSTGEAPGAEIGISDDATANSFEPEEDPDAVE